MTHIFTVSPGTRAARALILLLTATFAAGCEVIVMDPGERVVSSVQVLPSVRTLVVGEQIALTARARDSTGRIIGGRATTWQSTDSSVVTVTDAGVVTAVGTGTASIRATIDQKSGSGLLTVGLPTVASISVSPSAVVLSVGMTRQLTATVKDAAGNVLHDRPVTWTTDFPAVATVSQAGLMTGTGHGYVTITATSEGRSFSIGATVTNVEVDDMPLDLVHLGGGYSPQWISRP